MFDELRIPTKEISDRVLDLLILETERVLAEKKKVITGKTLRSLSGQSSETSRRVLIKFLADESLNFIQQGRRKGAKYPGRVVNGKFEVFPELKRWKEAVGFQGSDFILARSISEKGIKPTPIIEEVLGRVEQRVYDIIDEEWTEVAGEFVLSEVRQSFRALI